MNPKDILWEDFLKLKNSNETFLSFNVVTGSMEPLIPVGGKVIVDLSADYGVNDIIVFWHANKLMVHVLWNINKSVRYHDQQVLVTKSLNSKLLDTSITSQHVLGKVINYKLGFLSKLRLYLINRTRKF